MKASVVWSRRAERDLDDILDYLLRRSPQAAEKLVAELATRTDRLRDFPACGRRVPESSEPSLREVIVSGYRLVYELRGARAEILTLFHGRRRFPADVASLH